MAGSITKTEVRRGIIKHITLAWTSDASGNVNGIFTDAVYEGVLLAFLSTPSGGGTAPTAAYDIVLRGTDLLDLLQAQGANRSATVAELLSSGMLPVASLKLELVITNAGNAKQGTVDIWIG